MILKIAGLRTMGSLSVLVALLALCAQAQASCPPKWTHSPQHQMCYMGPHLSTYDDLLTFCKDNDGTIISSIQEKELRAALEPMYLIEPGEYWVGMEDKGKGEGLKLLDGQPVPDSVVWKNNEKPENSKTRMCGYVDSNDLQLSTTMCNQPLHGVCERKPVSCPDHWYPFVGDCMRVFHESKNWEEAKNACIDMGASPLKIPTSDHLTALWNMQLEKSIYSIWSGAKDSQWYDGSLVTGIGTMDFGRCGAIMFEGQGIMYMDCRYYKQYGCFLKGGSPQPKLLPTQKCSDGFKDIGDTCLWVSETRVTWQQAEDECNKKGAKLAIAPTEEGQFQIKATDNSKHFVYKYTWIGLSRKNTQDPFHWTDGSVILPSAKKDWELRNGLCGVHAEGCTTFCYADRDCTDTRRFICQKDQDQNVPQMIKPEVSQGSCGDGWEERPGTDTCYSFIDNDNVPPLEAEELCKSKGGHLVSINSQEEKDYLSDRLHYMIESIFWIGVEHSSNPLEGWGWTDGSPFAYRGFAKDQPRYITDDQVGYIDTSDMKWGIVDVTKEVFAGAICEKHLNEDEPSALTTPKPKVGEFYECDEHWSGYENSCYFVSTNKKTWWEARNACLEHNADLTSIENTEVNDFIYSILPEGCVDNDPKCDERRENGDCDSKPFLMGRLCPKTCEFCDGSCKDDKSTSYCRQFARQGLCRQDTSEPCKLTCGCDWASIEGYWIGLNSQQTVVQYEWSDKSKMTCTLWSDMEPNNHLDKYEECVVMHRYSGRWSDKRCDGKKSGFICEKPKTFKKEKIEDPSTVGCPDGAQGHEDKCYIVMHGKVEWSKAKENCEQNYQRLAILSNKLINSHVEAMLFASSIKVSWIGINYDKNSPKWVDGSVPTYTAKFKPRDLSDGQCGAAADSGYWESYDCTAELSYVCESHRDGYITPAPTQPPPTLKPTPCPAGWIGFRDKCYKIFSETKTWNEASDVCGKHGGSLTSISDEETSNAIVQIIHGFSVDDERAVWIGLIQEKDGEGFAWSDGAAYTVRYWAPDGYDDSFIAPTCASILHVGTWIAHSCYSELGFMCQVDPGVFIPDKVPFIAPVKFCEEEDKNGDKWREFEGKCYHASNNRDPDGVADWWKAREMCKDKGADLVSIHSSHENDFILELIKEFRDRDYWIGYHEHGLTEYAWADNTPNNYNPWSEGEPNNYKGAERCVVIYRRGAMTGRWNDELCLIEKGYICKKREGSMPPPTLPTEVDGVCPDGFKSERFSKRCYYYSGDDQKETWEDAYKACQKKYKQAELATIGGSIDQAFVTLLVEESKADDIWTGFHCSRQGSYGCEWMWVDNSVGSFTHWDLNRPQTRWTRNGEHCVVVQRITENVAAIGTWDHAKCDEKKPYLCQALRVPSSEEDKNPFEDQYNTAKCSGDDSFLYHGRCYTFHDTSKTWTGARDFCKQKGSELPVLMDTFEGARLNYEAYSDGEHTKFWTDVRFEKDLHKFVWGKDRDVQVTPWDSDEPDQSMDDSCVAYLDGHWYNDPCSEEKPFFCVDGDYNEDRSKPDPSDLHCESPNDEPHGNKCYWIPKKETATWPSANEQCETKGMALASIHSLDEAKFINDLLKKTRGDEKNAWIGFESGPIGACRWSDGSPVNFLYWDQFKENSDHEDCVEMMLDKEGKWNRRLCQEPLAYVCSKDKVVGKPLKADTSTAGADEDQQPDKPDTDDTSQAAKPDTDDTQQAAKPDTDDTPPAAKPDTDDKPQAAKPDTDDTQQDAKPDTDDTPPAAKPDTDDTQQATKPDVDDTPQGDYPDSQDQGHSDQDDGNPVSPKDDRIDGDGRQYNQKTRDDRKTGQMSGGAIAGVVFSVLAVLALVLVAVFLVRRRWPLWRLESILRGNNSSDGVEFHKAFYSQGGEGGIVDFGQSA